MIVQHYIQEIKNICYDFIKEHNGSTDGHFTFITGSTELNSSFLVELPENSNRTSEEIDEISNKLKVKIINYLVESELNVIVKFNHDYYKRNDDGIYVEPGYFNTYIEFVYPAGRLF